MADKMIKFGNRFCKIWVTAIKYDVIRKQCPVKTVGVTKIANIVYKNVKNSL